MVVGAGGGARKTPFTISRRSGRWCARRNGSRPELLPVEVAVGVGARARRVRTPTAGGCGEAAALNAVHARELKPRVDAREVQPRPRWSCTMSCERYAIHAGPSLEQIQRKSRVRERTPQNAPRIRAGVEKKDQKAELKTNQTRRRYAEKNPDFFQTTGRHPPGARRETTEVKGEDAEMLGPLPSGPQRTGRADQRDARGGANRDRITPNHRRRVLLCATQRPRSTNNETTTTTGHRELRDPRPTHPTVDLGDWGLR